MEKKKIALISLGCEKNLVDSEMILGLIKDKNVEIINKALEQNITLNLANIELEHHLKLAEKELKALEIIKKKKVNMISLLSSIEWHNPSHYNDSVGCPIGCELTQEEYDLLKEVLL